jgi:heparin/heparan-sulfate lyase
MGIALYDEDPLPYRYCAYKVLEELVPMRRFEYQSPRHNQGVSYAAYRFGWEMHAAWLMRRLCGREVFDPNIKSVPKYWLHMRLPNGEMLRDGDGICGGRYWNYTQTALLCYAYSGDPVVKGEFVRQGGLRGGDPVLFMLLNDPGVKAELSVESLPLTLDFGPVLGGMVARTGWNMATNSADVVAEVKGGGYHFGNHQHADAGSLQIYYRGLQVAKLGQYKFYGTPYDMNFGKRSAAQSMLLVVDPHEKILSGLANDGGSRFLQTHPRTPKQAAGDPLFSYGKVVSCGFGPSAQAPAFSYFCADLKAAYSEKVAAYSRRFCFLNLGLAGNPAAMIVLDDVVSSNPEFKKVWQLNTLRPPQVTPAGVRLWNVAGGVTGRLDVCMLRPGPEARELKMLSGEDAHVVDGKRYAPPSPDGAEANGCRIQFSPRLPQVRDRFLAVLQACDAEPLPVALDEDGAAVTLRIADRIVVLPASPQPSGESREISVPAGGKSCQVLCAGLEPGVWRVSSSDAPAREFAVEAGKNVLTFEARGGVCRVVRLAASR